MKLKSATKLEKNIQSTKEFPSTWVRPNAWNITMEQEDNYQIKKVLK